jgi:hypothetical protein
MLATPTSKREVTMKGVIKAIRMNITMTNTTTKETLATKVVMEVEAAGGVKIRKRIQKLSVTSP